MVRKSDIKRVLTLVLFAGILAGFSVLSVPVSGAVISLDFQSLQSGHDGMDPAIGDVSPAIGNTGNGGGAFVTGTDTAWNILQVGDSDKYNYGKTSGPLATMDGSATNNDVKFRITGSAGKVGRLWATGDYVYCTPSTYGGSNPVTAYDISWSGLIPGNSYDLAFFSYKDTCRITIDGVSKITVWNTGYTTFTGVVADENGVINGVFDRNPNKLSATNRLMAVQIQGDFDPFAGSPSGGVEVEPDFLRTLSWTNLDNAGNDIYVDVWFGTDPGDPNNFVKVVDSNTVEAPNPGLNLTSVDVDASGNPQVYYWRVVNYLNGPGNDANMVESPLYSFISKGDASPYDVSAGDDWITWVGEPVGLLGSFTDDGESAVTVTWSSSDSSAVFEPSNDGGVTSNHIAPTVTFSSVVGTVTLTFSVDDEGNDPVTDTMTIDVYQDVCEAGVAAGLSTIHPGDLNADCVTNIDDLLIMAQSWLVDTKLTDPVAK